MANGDITYDNPGGNLVPSAFASGTFTGVAAATNIQCGFKPNKIVLYNLTDASKFTWVKGMDAGTFTQQLAAGTTTVVTSGGPVVFDGNADEAEGFTIPNTAVFNTAADDVVWEASR